MDRRNGMLTHAFSESSLKPHGKNGLARRDTIDRSYRTPPSPDATTILRRTQAALQSGDSLVEFVEVWTPELGPGQNIQTRFKHVAQELHYLAYVLGSDGAIRAIDLGASSLIEQQIRDYRSSVAQYGELQASLLNGKSPLVQGKEAEEQKLARTLYESLWKPLFAGRLPTGHIYISPDSMLAVVPFDALIDEGGEFLIKRWDISYLTSGRELAEKSDLVGPLNNIDIFAIGRFGSANGTHTSASYPDLPNALVEGQTIKSYFPDARLYSNESATEKNLKSIINPQLLHFATHGYYFDPAKNADGIARGTPSNPQIRQKYRFLRSGLILDDGVLTSLEISLLELHYTRLVVLSACDSGASDVRLGDSISGMRGAFHMAGANALVSLLWKENDVAAESAMKYFYEGLSNGETIEASLRMAKLNLLNDESFANPYFWAPFVLEGNGNASLLHAVIR